MDTNILKTLSNYILDIDAMTMNEFCQVYNISIPSFEGKIKSQIKPQFELVFDLQISNIKQKMFVEYAKFLNKELCIEMFEGERKIFEGGKYVDRQPSTQWNTYEIAGVVIFQDSNTGINRPIGKRVFDLAGKGLKYSRLWV